MLNSSIYLSNNVLFRTSMNCYELRHAVFREDRFVFWSNMYILSYTPNLTKAMYSE